VPQHLPTFDEIIDPQEVKNAPEQWRQIGQEITEQLDYEPGRFLRRRLIRRKYVKREANHGAPVIAPLNTLQERSIAGAGLLAQIMVNKYCDHLPLYRQERIFATRHGIKIPRQSMARWMGQVAEWLRPIYEQIRIGVFEQGYAQADETPTKYLSPGHGQTKQGYLWTFKRPGGDVWYAWRLSRAATCLETLIPMSFHGYLQCDGYIAYETFAKAHRIRIQLAGCMAHMRRKFMECEPSQHVCWILLQIQHLYRIENGLRKQRAGPRLRQAVRSSDAKPVMERIYKALKILQARHLPQSDMGNAISYALGQWSKLCQYLKDGRIEIDNNLVENAIRPTVLGRRNWLFFGDAEAGEHSAIIYTVIESCRRRGLDPLSYLRDVLTRLPNMTNRQIPEIMQAAWAKSQAAQLQKAA